MPRFTALRENHYCRILLSAVLLLCFFPAASCIKDNSVNHIESLVNEEASDEIPVIIDPIREKAEEIVSSMDNRLLAAQIIISGIDGSGRLTGSARTLLKKIPTGGIMLFGYNLNTGNNAITALITEAATLINEESKIPPFISVDHEGGTVNRFRAGVANLPTAASYWDQYSRDGLGATLLQIEEDSLRAGSVLNSFGINMNFAPVAEQLINENRVFLARRSYGPDQLFVSMAAAAFMRGMDKAGVMCVIKHFPGSAGADPHYSASVLNMDKPSLDDLITPFTFLIDQGARAIMAAHTSAPAIDKSIATLSPAVMQNWLRDELGFKGIIISDDFIMAAAGKIRPEEAAVLSVAAGADMILVWPRDLEKTHKAFLTALEEGRLPKERLTTAVIRIISEKIRHGLIDIEG